MLKVKDQSYIKQMGFKKNDDDDYVYRENVNGSLTKLFTIYAGSLYIRHARTAYTSSNQIKCIYDWTKKGYIEWEE